MLFKTAERTTMKKTTKALSFLLSLCMMLSVFTFTVFAETQSGTCGDNLQWTLDNEGTLIISGTGDMYNYEYSSDEVLHILANDIESCGYQVEKSKRAEDKINVPVLFGRNGSLEKYFNADCYSSLEKVVIEIEAGRAVSNYQFLKDLFQACVMHDVDYLIIAVRNIYRNSKDFDKVINFLDTLYASNRLILPLKGILIIGY